MIDDSGIYHSLDHSRKTYSKDNRTNKRAFPMDTDTCFPPWHKLDPSQFDIRRLLSKATSTFSYQLEFKQKFCFTNVLKKEV
jgi:hypothetical protein